MTWLVAKCKKNEVELLKVIFKIHLRFNLFFIDQRFKLKQASFQKRKNLDSCSKIIYFVN